MQNPQCSTNGKEIMLGGKCVTLDPFLCHGSCVQLERYIYLPFCVRVCGFDITPCNQLIPYIYTKIYS